MTKPVTVEVRRFESVRTAIPHPDQPSKWIRAYLWQARDSGTLVIDGISYQPNNLGWYEVPADVANTLTAHAEWFSVSKALDAGISDLYDEPDEAEIVPIKKPTKR